MKILAFRQLSFLIFRLKNYTFLLISQHLTAKPAKFVEFCRIAFFDIFYIQKQFINAYRRIMAFAAGKRKMPSVSTKSIFIISY